MAEYYTYLIASLPMLHFGMKPPFSFERFLDVCSPFIPKEDFELVRALPRPEDYHTKGTRRPLVQKWIAFDTALRNELVRLRAGRKHADPAVFLRPEKYSGSSLAPVIMAANMTSSPLDAEEVLDDARWNTLDELARGHYFDLDFLITYAYKLLILGRWQNIRDADTTLLLERTLQQ